MTDHETFEQWWLEQTRQGDPARRLNLQRDAFIAGMLAARATAEQSAPVSIPAIFYNGDTKRDPALRAACDEQVRSSMAAAIAHRNAVIEQCISACEAERKNFFRAEDSAGDGIDGCIDAIRALKSQRGEGKS